MNRTTISFLLLVALVAFASPVLAATIVINNVDAPGQGFNDPGPAVLPAAGNPGTTVGEQRLFVFQRAAEIWGGILTSSETIVVQSTWQDRGFTPCTATGAVLGAAASIQDFLDFPNAHWPHSWYKVALANKLAGDDLAPGGPDPGFLVPPFADDIIAFFNPNLGQPNCLATSGWYYGTDNNEPAGRIDALSVVLHEIGHGLGFANIVDEDGDIADHENPGEGLLGFTDVYSAFTHDNTTGKQWNQMTDGERAASAVNSQNLVWNGPTVTNESPNVLSNRIDLKILTGSLTGTILEPIGTGSNATPTPANFNGEVIYVNDGVAGAGNPPGTVNDGCEAYGGVAGKIAMVDRGFCSFTVKATNAQAAGATGLLVVNNAGGDAVIGMSIAGPTIPAVMISTNDGNVVKANLPLSVGLIEDPTQLAGADADNHVKLFAPNPVQPGSSVSHWDTTAIPNLLMEPAINSSLLTAGGDLDLTDEQMVDIGWDGNLHCPDNSDSSSSTLVLANGCDTGVTNYFGPFISYFAPKGSSAAKGHFTAGGCTLVDTFATCSTYTKNAGQYAQCVDHVSQGLVKEGAISATERDAIKACTE